MNKRRRTEIEKLIERLADLESDIDGLYSEEEEYRDNMPENLQGSERYEAADSACDALSSARDSIGEAASYLQEALG